MWTQPFFYFNIILKKSRIREIYKASEKIINNRNYDLIGKNIEVMVDYNEKDNVYIGRSKKDAPEIDSITIINSKNKLKNSDIVNIKITKTENLNLFGDVV